MQRFRSNCLSGGEIMNKSSDIVPYRIRGRLADVIAAIQVMAAAKRPERKIKDWAYEFDRDRDADTVDRWTSVFQDHREFFLTYRRREDPDLKAALRWRYAFKTFDAESGKEYTPEEIQALPDEQRRSLTTKPLSGEQIQTLLNTAIGLHTRAMEELRESRWWIPVFAAILGFFGAMAGVILSAALDLVK
jgi:hypothetical protein